MAVQMTQNERTAFNAVALERPSVDEWIVEVLRERGAQTLDHLGGSLPGVNWAQFFLAIDRLSRTGKITLWPPKNGDYLVSLNDR
jgi:hypothetical protein